MSTTEIILAVWAAGWTVALALEVRRACRAHEKLGALRRFVARTAGTDVRP